MEPYMTMLPEVAQRLREDLIQKSPDSRLTAIHIYSNNDMFEGSGTLVLGPSGEHQRIITTAHHFQVGKIRQYRYRVLQPPEEHFYPIESAYSPVGIKEDVAICTPSMASWLEPPAIQGFSHFRSGDLGIEGPFQGFHISPRPTCVELFSGKSYAVAAMFEGESKDRYYVINRRSFPGESGLGFLSFNRNRILVLRGGFHPPDEMKKEFSIDPNCGEITLAAEVKTI